ncbi:hypothetical protein C9374_004828 [Naegleria lovaniensis]|uniref:F-box domain-containing protein n=1 Tax=Naegleria lovaniensis TaxID=51637 RepID=A0AA88GKX0_NAELO|nr:uncharacterized protein C9374_004828 [Naegleria lovaniensis]KAG2382861.1 hypothetical protein C9374_004828 [Naegleria lovaniensis]
MIDQLPDELLFSIMLYCEDLKTVSEMLLLNKRCLSMARYEALWRMRFAFFLKKEVWQEEAKLSHDLYKLQISKQKGQIRKLNEKIKTHVKEAESMYLREKHLCEVGAVLKEDEEDVLHLNHHPQLPANTLSEDKQKDDVTSSTVERGQQSQKLTANSIIEKTGGVVDFYIGYRFYTIAKKEVTGRATSKLHQEFSETYCSALKNFGLGQHGNQTLLVMNPDTNPLIIKWKKVVAFSQENFIADSNDHRDMEYHLQRKASPFLIASFFEDYYHIMKHVDKYFAGLNAPNERDQFQELNSKLVNPIIELTSTSKFQYPVNIFRLLEEGAFKLSDYTLNESLMHELKLELQRDDNSKKFKTVSIKDLDIINFLLPQFTALLHMSYDVSEIERILRFWIQEFPSLMSHVKSQPPYSATPPNTLSKSDVDVLASYLISRCPVRHQFIHHMSYELLIKATSDWGLYDQFDIPSTIDTIFHDYRKLHEHRGSNSFRTHPISDEELIDFIRLLEKLYNKGENVINANAAVTCVVFCSSWLLWKFCIEERKINLNEATSFFKSDSYYFAGPCSILYRFVDQQNRSMDEREYVSRVEYIMNHLDHSIDYHRHAVNTDPISSVLLRFVSFYSQQMPLDGSEQFLESLKTNTKVQRWKKLIQRMFEMGSRATRITNKAYVSQGYARYYYSVPFEMLSQYPLLCPFEDLITEQANIEETEEMESSMRYYDMLSLIQPSTTLSATQELPVQQEQYHHEEEQ